MNRMMHGHKDEKELGLKMLAFEVEQAKKNLRPAPPNVSLEDYRDKMDGMSELAKKVYQELPEIGGKASWQVASKLRLKDTRSAGNAMRNLERKGLAKVAYKRGGYAYFRRL